MCNFPRCQIRWAVGAVYYVLCARQMSGLAAAGWSLPGRRVCARNQPVLRPWAPQGPRKACDRRLQGGPKRRVISKIKRGMKAKRGKNRPIQFLRRVIITTLPSFNLSSSLHASMSSFPQSLAQAGLAAPVVVRPNNCSRVARRKQLRGVRLSLSHLPSDSGHVGCVLKKNVFPTISLTALGLMPL